jgi:hypothetical protein
VLLLVPLIPAGLSAWYHHSLFEERRAFASEVRKRLKAAKTILWLDARSEETRQRTPLPWSLRLAEATWEDDLSNILDIWEPGAVLTVFCDQQGCGLSQQVAERLRKETAIEPIMIIEGGESEAVRLHALLEEEPHP